MQKKQAYQWIKVYGLLSYIPLILAVGPLSGYFIGDFLEKKFGLAWQITLILAALGFISAIFETVRIIRLVGKILNRNQDG